MRQHLFTVDMMVEIHALSSERPGHNQFTCKTIATLTAGWLPCHAWFSCFTDLRHTHVNKDTRTVNCIEQDCSHYHKRFTSTESIHVQCKWVYMSFYYNVDVHMRKYSQFMLERELVHRFSLEYSCEKQNAQNIHVHIIVAICYKEFDNWSSIDPCTHMNKVFMWGKNVHIFGVCPVLYGLLMCVKVE